MPRALANNNRASGGASGGRIRAYVADPSCPCCDDDCPLWTRIVQCSPGPSCDGTPPPTPVEAWICATVRCIDGRPLAAGMVFLLDGTCWTVQIEQQQTPPPGALIVSGLDPVECVENCYDVRCPQGVLWLPATPCNPANPSGFICGVTECGIYTVNTGGCYRADPAGGYIPGSALPPGSNLFVPTSLPLPDCCTCEANSCDVCPLVGGSIVNPLCYPEGLSDRTCCRSPNACMRLVRMRGTQTLINPLFGTLFIENVMVNPATQPDGSIRWTRRRTRILNNGTPEVEFFPGPLFGCGQCPSWTFRAPRDGLDDTFSGFTWTEECDGQTGIPSITVSGWGNNSWTCRRQVQDVTYNYVDSNNGVSAVTRFEFEAIIEDEAGRVCSGDCFGRAVSAPRQPISGCSGCGAGNKMTEVR